MTTQSEPLRCPYCGSHDTYFEPPDGNKDQVLLRCLSCYVYFVEDPSSQEGKTK